MLVECWWGTLFIESGALLSSMVEQDCKLLCSANWLQQQQSMQGNGDVGFCLVLVTLPQETLVCASATVEKEACLIVRVSHCG